MSRFRQGQLEPLLPASAVQGAGRGEGRPAAPPAAPAPRPETARNSPLPPHTHFGLPADPARSGQPCSPSTDPGSLRTPAARDTPVYPQPIGVPVGTPPTPGSPLTPTRATTVPAGLWVGGGPRPRLPAGGVAAPQLLSSNSSGSSNRGGGRMARGSGRCGLSGALGAARPRRGVAKPLTSPPRWPWRAQGAGACLFQSGGGGGGASRAAGEPGSAAAPRPAPPGARAPPSEAAKFLRPARRGDFPGAPHSRGRSREPRPGASRPPHPTPSTRGRSAQRGPIPTSAAARVGVSRSEAWAWHRGRRGGGGGGGEREPCQTPPSGALRPPRNPGWASRGALHPHPTPSSPTAP